MKVLDLRCSNDHRFEGWFGSEDEYVAQIGSGLVDCPLCGDHAISRLPSAPRLNVSRARERDVAPHAGMNAGTARQGSAGSKGREMAPTPSLSSNDPAQSRRNNAAGDLTVSDLQAGWMQAVRHLIANTEDVGTRFAEEARRIHHGETEERPIRGQATRADAEALREEGIEVVAMRVPDALKGPLQ